MKTPRLIYFDMRGRAEAIRILLHATRTAFEEQRIVGSEEWAALKPTLPFGALPVYELGPMRLCQSHAILRHLGRRLIPASRGEPTATELDVAQEAIAESQEDLWRFNWRSSYYDRLESYAADTLRPRLEGLERWLSRSRAGGGEWFGPASSHVDCAGFAYLDEVDAFFPAVLADFPALSAFHSRVASLPAVSAYLASASRPAVFGMGRMGPKVDPRIRLPADATFSCPWSSPIDLAQALRGQRRLTRG